MSEHQMKLPVATLVTSGADPNGDHIGVEVIDQRGTGCVILIPHALGPTFVAAVLSGIEIAKQRRVARGIDTIHDNVLAAAPVTAVSSATGLSGSRTDGVLFLNFANGFTLSLSLTAAIVRDCQIHLAALESLLDAASSKPDPRRLQ